MQQIDLDDKSVIYLDHGKLINEMYEANDRSYALTQALFHFAPKPEINKESTPITTTKRKRKHDTAFAQSHPLQTLVERLLPRLWQRRLCAHPPDNCKSSCLHLTRCWEEPYTFPQFNGANNTSTFKHFTFGSQRFLIPPQCRFYNHDIEQLTPLLPELGAAYDLITLDPPWRNKYIKRLKRVRTELGYSLLDAAALSKVPLAELVHKRTLVAIWCTNSAQHQRILIDELLPAWHLRLLHQLPWLKLNTAGDLICPLRAGVTAEKGKQPYEMLYLACHCDSAPEFGAELRDVEALASIPSIVHSHKPPLRPWLCAALPEQPRCIELFARYLQPGCTSVGLEVLKLMDERLYEESGS